MASKDPEDPINNTAGTDEETVALRRKRLRRVSFVDREITSVHIFNRDEDYETPPNYSASDQLKGDQVGKDESEDKVIRFFGELVDGDDSRGLLCSPDEEGDADADDEVVAGKLFLRPKGSPSSGGSTVGSVTTDDEENFFGPVSAHFIRSGRLSDSAATEENHDITMDSTAFSMHFQSLVMSEPGDAKTPTSSRVGVEEKTPTQVTPRSETGGVMVLTKVKKLFPKSPLPIDKVSGGRDSNDMSLVGDNSLKYDYACLSPTLEALLADESKAQYHASMDDGVTLSSPGYDISSSPLNRHRPTFQRYEETQGTYGVDVCRIQTPDSTVREPQFLRQESGSQFHTEGDSLSSSISRGLDSYIDTVDVPKSLSCVTPSPKQQGSFLSRNTLALVESLSSIQKSNSGFGLIKAASPASALLDRIENSKLVLSGYHTISTPSSIGRQGSSKDLQEKHVEIPITNLEGELSKLDNRTPTRESKGIINQNTGDILTPSIDIDACSTDIQSHKDVFAYITAGKMTESLEEDSSSKQQEHNHFVSENSTQETATGKGLIESVSLLGETTFDFRNKSPKTSISTKFVLCPENGSNLKGPSSANNGTLDCLGQGNEAIRKCGSGGENLNEKYLNVASEKVHSRLVESGSLLTETGTLDGIAQPKGKDSVLNEIQNLTENTTMAQPPLKARNHLKVPSGSPNKHFHAATQVICSNEKFPVVVTETNSGKHGSPLVDRSIYEASLVKLNQSTPSREATKSPSSLKKLTNIPSKELLHKAPHKGNARLAGEDFSSLTFSLNRSIENMQNQGSSLVPKGISEPNTENSTQLKRKAEDIDHSVRNSSAQRCPKVQKSSQHILQPAIDCPDGSIGAICPVGRENIVNWREIPGKVSLEINQLFAPLADKLNPRLMCKLEDILVHLKKVHLCEMLCFRIQSQKVYDELSVKSKRCADNKLLLCKIAYEKAKLQLLYLKQEALQKKAQIVASGIQTLEILELECSKLICQYGERYSEVVTGGCHSFGSPTPESVCEEIKVLDSRIEHLLKSFHMSHKTTGELTYVDTIAMLEDLLQKKMRRRLMLKDFQNWKVDSINNRTDYHSIVLNYGGFINQRIKLKPGPVPCVLMSNNFNDTVIRKHFPNVNALIAFGSLFSTEYTKKYFASKVLAEETQKTSLLLHNMLDVVEEFQLARMELPNLVQGNFNSPSAEQLHLQITFADCINCQKVIVILDMACLTLGNYPADIVPCKLLETSPTGAKSSLSNSSLIKMKSAINDLRVGYPRILRLCRCVSRVLQS